MSLPPQLIRVKRKRTEEGPVPSFLRIEHTTKRHRSEAFLYRRHDPVEAAARAAKAAAAEAESVFPAGRPPVIHASPSGAKKRLKAEADAILNGPNAHKAETGPAGAPAAIPPVEPRRFHLSRESLLGPRAGKITAPALGLSGIAGIRKNTRYQSAKAATAAAESVIFIERSKRRHRISASRNGNRSEKTRHTAISGQQTTAVVPPAVTVEAPAPSSDSTLSPTTASVPRLPKRPSWRGPLRAASQASAETSSPPAGDVSEEAGPGPSDSKAPALPQSLLNRQWDTDMDRLAQEMNNYTLEMIGRNLARMDQESRAAEAQREAAKKRAEAADMMAEIAAEKRRAAYAKYKPKPVPRYAERHVPSHGDVGGQEGGQDTAMVPADGEKAAHGVESSRRNDASSDSGAGSETDDDDYVTETYVRIPGHEVKHAGGTEPGSVGLLVFDNEPDIEVFYGAEEESEDEFDDDEDENAENYYTHDYPEDEVASDDEFDRDAYHYLTGNASDLEEFEDSGDEGASEGVRDGSRKLFSGSRFPGADGI